MADSFQISCNAFKYGEEIPVEFTCDGGNRRPMLNVNGIPDNTESLAIILEDPDAPSGIFTHWISWNISPKNELKANGESMGVEGKNDFHETGYGGPCPSAGATHHYYFRLYALDTTLQLDSDTGRDEFLAAIEGHIIARAELMGTYTHRNRN